MDDVEAFDSKVRVEEYKVWKKNAPFLYDLVLTHALEWPSLTVEWIADEAGGAHKLLLGTHTSGGATNHLLVAAVNLPDAADGDAPAPARAGKAAGAAAPGKIEIRIKVNHDGEVNRARHCPQNPFLIATKSPSAAVLVFDVSKHPSVPADNKCTPEHRCTGHDKEGYGLAWNPLSAGQLLSGSDDGRVCFWDVREASATHAATAKWTGHTDVVEDVAWHPHAPRVFGSVGDDKRLLVWDLRSDAPIISVENAHDSHINSLAFNPHHEFLLATGGTDAVVRLWDLRNTTAPVCELHGHGDVISQVQWAPFGQGYVLASCGADRRVRVWDLSRLGASQTENEAEDGPPELAFIHGGHTAKVSDFGFNAQHDWLVASVAEDNVVQIWQMASPPAAAAD